jgi:predicted DNA-binding transcriptional regulator AlpA
MNIEYPREEHPIIGNDDRVMTFAAWCQLNGFSEATGRRILASGRGPRIIQLSQRRIGVRVRDNRAWQDERARAGA